MSNKLQKTVLKPIINIPFIDIISDYNIIHYLNNIKNEEILTKDELIIKNNMLSFINNKLNKHDICIQTEPIIDNDPDIITVNTVKIVEYIKDNIKYIKRIEKKETIHTTITTTSIL